MKKVKMFFKIVGIGLSIWGLISIPLHFKQVNANKEIKMELQQTKEENANLKNKVNALEVQDRADKRMALSKTILEISKTLKNADIYKKHIEIQKQIDKVLDN